MGLNHVLPTKHRQSPEKLKQVQLEMQQVLDFAKIDSLEKFPCLRGTIDNGSKTFT